MKTRTIHEAAAKGAIEAVKYFIARSANVNDMKESVNSRGEIYELSRRMGDFGRNMTPLHLAAYHGHTGVVAILAEAKADLNLRDAWNKTPGNTALEIAIRRDCLGTAKKLVECGAEDTKGILEKALKKRDIDDELFHAALYKRPEVIDEIHESGLLTKKAGERALRYAAEYGSTKVAAALLKYDINPNAYAYDKPLSFSINHEHRTPLGIAAEYGQYGVAKLLLEHKAAVDQYTDTSSFQHDRTPLSNALIHIGDKHPANPRLIALLLEHKADVNKINERSLSMLPSNGNADEIALLLKSGLNPNATPEGESLLSLAISRPKIASLLIDYGADVKELTKEGLSYLHRTSNMDLLKKLVAKGLDANAKDKLGKTPLQYARNKEEAELLIEHGADYMVLSPLSDLVQSSEIIKKKFNEKGIFTTRYIPPIFSDFLHKTPDVIEEKVKQWKEVNDVDWEGHSALHFSSSQGLKTVTRLLLEKKANVDLTDNEGNTALHYAAGKGQIEILKILKEYKADYSIKNKKGRTAMSVANDGLITAQLNDAFLSEIGCDNPKERDKFSSTLAILKSMQLPVQSRRKYHENRETVENFSNDYWTQADKAGKEIEELMRNEPYDLLRFDREMRQSISGVLRRTGNPFSSLFNAPKKEGTLDDKPKTFSNRK